MAIDRSSGSWWRGFGATFRLGARHIAEGTDHLLFLLALLLPAPLIAAGVRWGGYAGGKVALRRILKVVTAFTVGHSLTLVLGSLGLVHVPQPPIEAAIALSIFVSAIHALLPIFRGKEILIAGGFGLVHGLSFAAVLSDFGFDPLTLVSSVLGFNLGIEAFQLLVILVTMPWLVLLARTRVYPAFRVAGALATGIAAASWFFERALGWSNPVGPLGRARGGPRPLGRGGARRARAPRPPSRAGAGRGGDGVSLARYERVYRQSAPAPAINRTFPAQMPSYAHDRSRRRRVVRRSPASSPRTVG